MLTYSGPLLILALTQAQQQQVAQVVGKEPPLLSVGVGVAVAVGMRF